LCRVEVLGVGEVRRYLLTYLSEYLAYSRYLILNIKQGWYFIIEEANVLFVCWGVVLGWNMREPWRLKTVEKEAYTVHVTEQVGMYLVGSMSAMKGLYLLVDGGCIGTTVGHVREYTVDLQMDKRELVLRLNVKFRM